MPAQPDPLTVGHDIGITLVTVAQIDATGRFLRHFPFCQLVESSLQSLWIIDEFLWQYGTHILIGQIGLDIRPHDPDLIIVDGCRHRSEEHTSELQSLRRTSFA